MSEPRVCFPCACGRQLQAAVAHVGRWVRCPHCGQRVCIPAPAYQPAVAHPVTTPGPAPPRGPDSPHRQMCSICQTPLEPSDARTTCSACNLPFHTECWQQNYGCSAYGCAQVNALKRPPDLRIGDGPDWALPANAPRPQPRAGRGRPVPADSEMPWEHVLLAGSVLAVLVGIVTFGLPCLAVAVAVIVYLTMTEGRRGLIVLMLDLVLSVVGLVGGIVASYFLWVR